MALARCPGLVFETNMKIKQKAELTFGDFVAGAYQAWGAGQAANMVWLMTKARLVVMRELPPFLISTTKGRTV